VDLWKSAQQPQLPVSLERLGDPILTVAYNLVNISATTDVWYGFQDIRDRFVARFSSYLLLRESGQYTFWSEVNPDDDQVFLQIDGMPVATSGGQIVLHDQFCFLDLQYNEHLGLAACALMWLPPGQQEKRIIPEDVFHREARDGYPVQITDNVDWRPSLQFLRDGIELSQTDPFPFGDTALEFVARDSAANEARCTIVVTLLDHDECALNNGGCDEYSICTNTEGSRECSPCPFGYRGSSYQRCDVVDQCVDQTHNCSSYYSDCKLTQPGLFACICQPGFIGDGYWHDDIGVETNNGCLDVEPPATICPPKIFLDAFPNRPTIEIVIPPLNVTDNSGIVQGVSIIHSPSGQAEIAGELITVDVGISSLMYTAQDPTLNIGSCSTSVVIYGFVGIQPSIDGIALWSVEWLDGIQPWSVHTVRIAESSTTPTIVDVILGYPISLNTTVTLIPRFEGPASRILNVTPSNITFNDSTWNQSISVNVSIIHENVIDQGLFYNASLIFSTADCDDERFTNLESAPVRISVDDNDVAGLKLSADGVDVTEGGVVAYTVVLLTQPSNVVRVMIISDEIADFTTSQALVFTVGNWSIPQSVTLSAFDDLYDEGDVELHIASHILSSADPNYNSTYAAFCRDGHRCNTWLGKKSQGVIEDIEVSIIDNDAAPLPRYFGIYSVPLGPTTGSTEVVLYPRYPVDKFTEIERQENTYLYGHFANQFQINCRVYDVVRQTRRICPEDCQWDPVQGAAVCYSPFIIYPGPKTFEMRVRWSTRSSTAWIPAFDTFTYHLPMLLDLAVPISGPTNGGTAMKIWARNVDDSQPATMFCAFGKNTNGTANLAVAALSMPPGRTPYVECVSPEVQTPEIVDVQLMVNGAQLSLTRLRYQFYDNDCSISDLDLASGPLFGGTTVHLEGINFVDTGGIQCEFNVTALGVSSSVPGKFISATRILCVTPSMPAPAIAILTLSLNGQQYCSGDSTTFAFYESPTVQSVTPNNVHVGTNPAISTLLVLAINWTESKTLYCKLGTEGTAINGIILSSTMATCDFDVSHTGGPIMIFISLNGQQFVETDLYFYFTPLLGSIHPKLGPIDGGTELIISGQGFTEDIMTCSFGDSIVRAEVLDSRRLVCNTSRIQVGAPVNVAVSADGVFYIESPLAIFQYHVQPKVIELSRYAIPQTGRIWIDITIENMQLPLGSVANIRLRPVGEQNALPLPLVGTTMVLADNYLDFVTSVEVPDLFHYGELSLGDLLVEMSLNGQQYSNHSRTMNVFDALMPARVFSLRPASGHVDGGTVITLHGENFADLSSLQCKFFTSNNDTVIGDGTFVSSTLATCITPAYYAPLPPAGSAVMKVALSNLGSDWSDTTNTSIFRYSLTRPTTSISYGAGLGQSQVDIVVAGTMATFRIDAKQTANTPASAGGDMFYVELTPTGHTARVRDGGVFALDPAFTRVETHLHDEAARLAAIAVVSNSTAVTAARDAEVAAQRTRDALAGLAGLAKISAGGVSSLNGRPRSYYEAALAEQTIVAESAQIEQQVAEVYAEETAELLAHAIAQAEHAWHEVEESMFSDTLAVHDAIAIARNTYNSYYCDMFDTVYECCLTSPASCWHIEDTVGSHLAAYNLTVSGYYSISIFNAGAHVGSSPFLVQVFPDTLSETRSTVTGLNGEPMVVGDTIELGFQPRDLYGNVRIEPLDSIVHPGKGENVTVTIAVQTGLKAREIGWFIQNSVGRTIWFVDRDTYSDDMLYIQRLTVPSQTYKFFATASGGQGWHNAKLSIVDEATSLSIIDETLGNFGPRKVFPFAIGVGIRIRCQEIMGTVEYADSPLVIESEEYLFDLEAQLAAAEAAGQDWLLRGLSAAIAMTKTWLIAERIKDRAALAAKVAGIEALPSVSTISISVLKPSVSAEGHGEVAEGDIERGDAGALTDLVEQADDRLTEMIPVHLRSTQYRSFLFRFSVNGIALPLDGSVITFLSAATSAEHSVFTDTSIICTAGYICNFGLTTKDRFENIRDDTTGGDLFNGHGLVYRVGVPVEVPIIVADNADSTYNLSFAPTVSGVYSIDIRLNGSSVGGGDLTMLVIPDVIHVPSTTVTGLGSYQATAGNITEYVLQARDRFMNNRTEDDGTFGVSIHRDASPALRSCTDWGSEGFIGTICGNEGQTPCDGLSCPGLIGYGAWNCSDILVQNVFDLVPVSHMCTATCGVCDATLQQVFTADHVSDGRYYGTYNITKIGIIQHTAALFTAQDSFHAPDVLVIPAVADMYTSIISGDGFVNSVAGRWANIDLLLKDHYHNIRIYGGEINSMKLTYERGILVRPEDCKDKQLPSVYGKVSCQDLLATHNFCPDVPDVAAACCACDPNAIGPLGPNPNVTLPDILVPMPLRPFWSHRPDLVPETVEWVDMGRGAYTCRYLFHPAAPYSMSLLHLGRHFQPASPFNINKTLAQPPRVTQATIDSSLTRVVVAFDTPTNMVDLTSSGCRQLLNDTHGGLAFEFAHRSTCDWADSTSLIMSSPGVNSTLISQLIDNRIRLQHSMPVDAPVEVQLVAEAGIVTEYENSQAAADMLSFSLPQDVTPPHIVLEGPIELGVCDDLILSAERTYGGAAPMRFSWSATNHQYQFLMSETKLLGTYVIGVTTSQLELKGTDLIAGRRYQFSVTATNALGLISTAFWTVTKMAHQLPVVQMQQPFRHVFRRDRTVLSARADVPKLDCDGMTASGSLEFEWNQVAGPAVRLDILGATGPTLYIPSDILEPNELYRFNLSTWQQGQPVNTTSYCTAEVMVDPAPLVAWIKGGDRSVSVENGIELHIQTNEELTPHKVSCTWACTSQDPDGSRISCRNLTGVPYIRGYQSHGTELQLPVDCNLRLSSHTVGIGVHHFTASVRTTLRFDGHADHVQETSVSGTLFIKGEILPLPQIQVIQPVRHAMISDQMVLRGAHPPKSTVLWQTDRFSLLHLPVEPVWKERSTPSRLILGSGSLQPGVKYTFFLAATDASGSVGFDSAEVATNRPPCCGSLTIEPAEGHALTTTFGLFAGASATGALWTDEQGDLPLRFGFSYARTVADAGYHLSSEPQLQSSMFVTLPTGGDESHTTPPAEIHHYRDETNATEEQLVPNPLYISVHVSDNYGATSTAAPQVVSVLPTNLTGTGSEVAMHIIDKSLDLMIARGDVDQAFVTCLSLLDFFNAADNVMDFADRSRRLEELGHRMLRTSSARNPARLAVRDRLAVVIHQLAVVASPKSVDSQLLLLRMLSDAPCELSDAAIQAAVDALLLNIPRLGSKPSADLLTTIGSLVLALTHDFCEDHESPGCANNCNGHGTCVLGECKCHEYTCAEARCQLVPTPGTSTGCGAGLPDYCDSTGQCYQASCSKGNCNPSDASCYGGHCVAKSDGRNCFLGPCPAQTQAFVTPGCLLSQQAVDIAHANDQHRRSCLLVAITDPVAHFGSAMAADIVVDEPVLEFKREDALSLVAVALESNQMGALTIPAPGDIYPPATMRLYSQCNDSRPLRAWTVSWATDPHLSELRDHVDGIVRLSRVTSLGFDYASASCFMSSRSDIEFASSWSETQADAEWERLDPNSGSDSGSGSWNEDSSDEETTELVLALPTAQETLADILRVKAGGGTVGIQCRIWDPQSRVWKAALGCYVLSHDSSSTRCACTEFPREHWRPTSPLSMAVFALAVPKVVPPRMADEQPPATHYLVRASSLLVVYAMLSTCITFAFVFCVACSATQSRLHQRELRRGIGRVVKADEDRFKTKPVPTTRQRGWASSGSGSRGSSRALVVRASLSNESLVVGDRESMTEGMSGLVSVEGRGRCCNCRQLWRRARRRSSSGTTVSRYDAETAAAAPEDSKPRCIGPMGRRLRAVHPCVALAVATYRDVVNSPRRLAVLLCLLLGNGAACALLVAGDSDCAPNWHFKDCPDHDLACLCVPTPASEPERFDGLKVALIACAVAAAALPAAPIFAGLFGRVRRNPRDEARAARGPGGRAWMVHDFATDTRALTLLQARARAIIAARRVVDVRKVRLSQPSKAEAVGFAALYDELVAPPRSAVDAPQPAVGLPPLLEAPPPPVEMTGGDELVLCKKDKGNMAFSLLKKKEVVITSRTTVVHKTDVAIRRQPVALSALVGHSDTNPDAFAMGRAAIKIQRWALRQLFKRKAREFRRLAITRPPPVMDADGDGEVRYEEFREWWRDLERRSAKGTLQEISNKRLRQLFAEVDVSGDGTLDRKEITGFIRQLTGPPAEPPPPEPRCCTRARTRPRPVRPRVEHGHTFPHYCASLVWLAAVVWCMACLAYTVAQGATFDREEALEWAASAAIACAARAAILFPLEPVCRRHGATSKAVAAPGRRESASRRRLPLNERPRSNQTRRRRRASVWWR
jgi:hypothetical protein